MSSALARDRSANDAYYTPAALAAQLVMLLPIEPGEWILEHEGPTELEVLSWKGRT